MSVRLLKDPATVSSRIFVGHLQTDDMTKHELEEHFAKYGTVVGSAINRGFGFVQFEDEQSAQKAIQNENGAMFKGRRIGMLVCLIYVCIIVWNRVLENSAIMEDWAKTIHECLH